MGSYVKAHNMMERRAQTTRKMDPCLDTKRQKIYQKIENFKALEETIPAWKQETISHSKWASELIESKNNFPVLSN